MARMITSCSGSSGSRLTGGGHGHAARPRLSLPSVTSRGLRGPRNRLRPSTRRRRWNRFLSRSSCQVQTRTSAASGVIAVEGTALGVGAAFGRRCGAEGLRRQRLMGASTSSSSSALWQSGSIRPRPNLAPRALSHPHRPLPHHPRTSVPRKSPSRPRNIWTAFRPNSLRDRRSTPESTQSAASVQPTRSINGLLFS